MALVQCPECGAQISSYALSCPSCGFAPWRRRWRRVRKIVAAAVILILALSVLQYVWR